jgi:hypothetical protein
MSKFHAARLLYGRLAALHNYGPGLRWLYKLDAAARLVWRTARSCHSATLPVIVSKEDKSYQETTRQLCTAIADHLGVSEVIDSLDTAKQDLCCRYHYLRHDAECSEHCFELLEGSRRPEPPLDWAILTAIYTQDIVLVTRLLEIQRLQLDSNAKLFASLQYSAGRNCETIFRLLLHAGVDINELGHASLYDYDQYNNGSALEAACAAGCVEIIKICLSPEHNLKASGEPFETAMILAARLDDHEMGFKIVKWLISRLTSWARSMTTAQTIFEIACRNGSVDLGKLIYEKAPYSLNVPCREEDSALGMAVESGNVDMVIFVLSQLRTGTKMFPGPQAGWWREVHIRRAMNCAAEFGHMHIASLLWNELDSWSMRRPLLTAAEHGHSSIIEFLMSKGLDLSAQFSAREPQTNGERALMLAAEHGHNFTTRFLLYLGVRALDLDCVSCVKDQVARYATRTAEIQHL